MARHQITPVAGDGDRDGIGGRPHLRNGEWPVCRHEHVVTAEGHARCPRYGQPLTHFLRFDVRAEWETPFPAGSHFSLFQCVACADAFMPPSGEAPPWQLRERFWATEGLEPGKNYSNYGWWYASLEPPGAPLVQAGYAEPLVAPRALEITEGEGEIIVGAKIPEGRHPFRCACGALLERVVGIGGDVPFPTLPGAPKQCGTYSSRNYMVFLGNQTTMLACPKGCDPWAVVPFG